MMNDDMVLVMTGECHNESIVFWIDDADDL
jgi:hypothetical protein